MKNEKIHEKIDVVILWVDGNDEAWLDEKNKYLNLEGDTGENRFRDCDNLQYLFRGLDKYAPWVNKIFFITWNHIPKWLDTNNEKVVVVKHHEFIPEQYLPTFNSNVIELNLHRIKELSEKFILFNDDFFILKKTKPTDFFINGKPTDVYVENIQSTYCYNNIYFFMKSNILALVNKHFNKKKFVRKHFTKIINFKYGKWNLKTLKCLKFKEEFCGFDEFHAPQAYLKSTFRKIWEEEPEYLDFACHNRFRTSTDLGHYMCRYWQLLSGNFVPKKHESKYLVYLNDNIENIKQLTSGKYKYVCVNDAFEDIDFERSKKEINNTLEELLPEKSQFEL